MRFGREELRTATPGDAESVAADIVLYQGVTVRQAPSIASSIRLGLVPLVSNLDAF